MACFRLFTFWPERPDRSVPRLRSCMARLTFRPAVEPYLRPEDRRLVAMVSYLRVHLKGGGSVGVTGRSSGSGAVFGGAMTGGAPSDGAAIVLGAGSSGCRADAGGGASFGVLVAVGEAFALGARVSSGERPVCPPGAATACNGDVPADAGTGEGTASVAGTRALTEGDHT